MATFNSVQYAKTQATPVQGYPLETNELEGRVRVAYAKLTGGEQTLAQDDLVNLFKLPSGRVRPVGISVVHGAFGAGVTLDISDGSTENALASEVDVSAAGNSALAPATMAIIEDGPVIQAKFEGANPEDDQDLGVALLYVVD